MNSHLPKQLLPLILIGLTGSLLVLARPASAFISPSANPSAVPSATASKTAGATGTNVDVTSPDTERAQTSARKDEFEPGVTPFVVRVGREIIPYRLMAVFAEPDTWVHIEVLRGIPGSAYRITATRGVLVPLTTRSWAWNAPATPGLYPLRITGHLTGTSMTLQAFVLEPFEERQTSLNGYRIGRYRPVALGGNEAYAPPDGFVRVTEELLDVQVSPHFRLRQFLCKQTHTFPQYALVRTRLLIKLEMILRALHDAGHAAPTLTVQSAFRTPYHNHAIGAQTAYSRHLYGDAADIFVDSDGDGRMDDLSGDGQLSKADADVLARLVQTVEDRLGVDAFVGGIGVYGPPHYNNAFVHVDTRGSRARW